MRKALPVSSVCWNGSPSPIGNTKYFVFVSMWVISDNVGILELYLANLANMNRCWGARQRGECAEKLSQPVMFLAARHHGPSQLSGEKRWNTGICFTFAPVGNMKDLNKCIQMFLWYCDWVHVPAYTVYIEPFRSKPTLSTLTSVSLFFYFLSISSPLCFLLTSPLSPVLSHC